MKVIIDIDNTLSLSDKRFRLAKKENGKIDWDIAHSPENMILDEPNHAMVHLTNKYKKDGFEVVILTGRPESTEDVTINWLNKHDIQYDKLYMRSKEDYSIKAVEYKKKIYQTEIIDDVFCAYDDDEDIIQLWNSLNITAFKVHTVQ